MAPSVSWQQCDKLRHEVHASLAKCEECCMMAVLTDVWSRIMLDTGCIGNNLVVLPSAICTQQPLI